MSRDRRADPPSTRPPPAIAPCFADLVGHVLISTVELQPWLHVITAGPGDRDDGHLVIGTRAQSMRSDGNRGPVHVPDLERRVDGTYILAAGEEMAPGGDRQI